MANKVEQIVSTLQKLYEKRAAISKQIEDAEKKLATAVSTVSQLASTASEKKDAAKNLLAKLPIKK